jgi:hypothetical protein
MYFSSTPHAAKSRQSNAIRPDLVNTLLLQFHHFGQRPWPYHQRTRFSRSVYNQSQFQNVMTKIHIM